MMGNRPDGSQGCRQRDGPHDSRFFNNNNRIARCADFIPRKKYYRSHPYVPRDACGFQLLQTCGGSGGGGVPSRSYSYHDYSHPVNFDPHFHFNDDGFRTETPKPEQDEAVSPGGEEETNSTPEPSSSSPSSSPSVILIGKGGDGTIVDSFEGGSNEHELENIFVPSQHNSLLVPAPPPQILNDQSDDQLSTTPPPTTFVDVGTSPKLSTPSRLFSNFPEIHEKCPTPPSQSQSQQPPSLSQSEVEFDPNFFPKGHNNFCTFLPASHFDLSGSPEPEPPEEVRQLVFLLSEPVKVSNYNNHKFVHNGGGPQLDTDDDVSTVLDVPVEIHHVDYFSRFPTPPSWGWLVIGGIMMTTIYFIGRHHSTQLLTKIPIHVVADKVRSCGCPADAPHNLQCKLGLISN